MQGLFYCKSVFSLNFATYTLEHARDKNYHTRNYKRNHIKI